MRTKRLFRKILSMQLVLIVILSIFFNIIIGAKGVQAAGYTQYSKKGISEFPSSYQNALKKLSELHPNWTFTAFYTGMSWEDFINKETSAHLRNTVHNSRDVSWKCSCGQVASGYACASRSILEYYADPRNFTTESGIFQFLEMSYNSSVHTKAGVQSIIKGTFMDKNITFTLDGQQKTMHYADIIMDAAKESKISPYSIAIKIIQEVGRQGSQSVSGTYPGYEGLYNFFNIGAYDQGNAIENGLIKAREKGWTNQYVSIIEGSKYMADSYINVGQNTAYFYKFDVVDGSNGVCWHQYMTNIEDPSSQAKNLYNTYAKNNILDASLNFIIPVFSNMPGMSNLPTDMDPSASDSYYVNGTGVSLRDGATTSANKIATLSKNEVVKVIEFNKAEADGYNWAYIERSNGVKGYVANRYLTSANGNGNSSSIAKIENTYIITVPNTKISDIAQELSITSYEVKNGSGQVVNAENNAATTYVLNNKNANKYYTIVTLGDANGDGTINSGDLFAVKKHLLGTALSTESAKKSADANRDGTINSGDLFAIKAHLLDSKKISL